MNSATLTREVPPADGRVERRGVAWLVLALALAWAGGVVWRRAAPAAPALASHQRSAFAALDAGDQGLFNDLRTAAEEIRALRAPGSGAVWPEPAALAAQAMPPFVEDAAWARRGRLAWQRLDAHSPDHAVYWGRNAAVEWALVLSGVQASVWRRAPRPDAAIPQAIPEMLALDGWVEFIARRPGS